MPAAQTLKISDIVDARPVGALQYRVFALCALVAFMDGFDTQAIGYVAPLLATAVARPLADFGLVFSAGLAGAAAGAFGFGPLADRYGRRRPLIAACLVFAVFSIATVFVTSFGQLVLVRVLTGIGLGGAIPTCLALVAEYAPQRSRGLAVTAMFAAFPLGGFLAGLAASAMISVWGWQAVFVLGGALPLGIAVVLIARLAESPGYLIARDPGGAAVRAIVAELAPDLERSDYVLVGGEEKASRNPFREVFADGRVLVTVLLWVPFFLGFMVLLTVVLWGPSLLKESGLPLPVTSLIMAVHYLGGFIGTATSGWLVDRFGALKVLITSFVTGALCLTLFGQVTSQVLLGAVALLCGIFVTAGANGMLAVAARLYPTPVRSTGIGWAMAMGRFGQLVGPVLVVLMVAAKVSMPAIFIAAAIPCPASAAFLVMVHLAAPKRGHLEPAAAAAR
ncbi:MAG: MFS transporter [Alphaproteobacteria bacterium]|nr:MFS transporter [Alphaproteobacteria bacterium]